MLRPPSHRGPLIASGAAALTVGVLLAQLRLGDWSAGAHLAITAPASALLLWLGLQARLEAGRPAAYQTVLLVSGLVLLAVALVRLADVLGADFDGFPAGAVTWVAAAHAGASAFAAVRRNSAICALLAAIGGAIAVLAAVRWIFDAGSVTTYRWLLLLIAVALATISLPLRSVSHRHADQMVNAAGLAVLAIAGTSLSLSFLTGVGVGLPFGWELVLLAGGFGLVAYAAADRVPGPAYLGALIIGLFVVIAGSTGDSLEWWPAFLLVIGALALIAGLRPSRPLPPEPPAYTQDDLPLAARSQGDVAVRVRQD